MKKRKKKTSVGVGEGTRERKLTIIEHGEQSAGTLYMSCDSNFPTVSDHFNINKYMDKNVWFEN